MTLCLVTDRRRFEPPIQGLLAQLRRAVEAGIDLIQIRERDLEAIDLASLVSAAVAAARGSRSRVVVNDRLDVAIACGAAGVHLRSDSFAISEARRIAPKGFLVGRSVHRPEEAAAAADADYLIAGAVFPTTSKPDRSQWLGCDGLAAIVRATTVPVLAIGGIDVHRAADVAIAGAAGVAAIGCFDSESMAAVVAEMRRRFDSVRAAP